MSHIQLCTAPSTSLKLLLPPPTFLPRYACAERGDRQGQYVQAWALFNVKRAALSLTDAKSDGEIVHCSITDISSADIRTAGFEVRIFEDM